MCVCTYTRGGCTGAQIVLLSSRWYSFQRILQRRFPTCGKGRGLVLNLFSNLGALLVLLDLEIGLLQK